jgi:Rrf2 family protein
MNISVKAEYALQAIFVLATQSPGGPVKIADIVRRRKMPEKFLGLILASLKHGGFVASRRGSDGGYCLARPADQITIGQVMRFVDGKRVKFSRGPFTEVWRRVDASISDVVDHTSFAELVRRWRESQPRHVPSRQA